MNDALIPSAHLPKGTSRELRLGLQRLDLPLEAAPIGAIYTVEDYGVSDGETGGSRCDFEKVSADGWELASFHTLY